MTSKVLEQEVCQSVLEFVADGTYPASEQVIAAEFPTSALSNELELLAKAREQVEAEISALSRGNDFDADGWISQAKQLHADIERSRVTAREIVAQHENSKPLQMKVEDAAAKVGLVETEIVFNEAVTRALEEVQRLYQQLEAGRVTLREGRVMKAIDTLEEVERSVNQDGLFSNTNVMHVLFENVAELRREIIMSLHARWAEQLNIDKKQRRLEVSDKSGNLLDETISALSRLKLLAAANDKFQNDLVSAIIDPILVPSRDGYSRALQVDNCTLQVGQEPSAATVPEVLDRIVTVLDFLRQCLPSAVLDPFSVNFIPTLSSKVIASWLSSAIPTELTGLGDFERMLDDVLGLGKKIESLGWHGQEELVSWVNQAPRLWLAQRRVDSLDQVRKVLAASQGTTQQVERVEKEQVSQEDDVLLEKPASDDWDAEWDDDEDESKAPKTTTQDDEEDVSAWGLDDDTKEETGAAADDDDGADAWGWGDEDQEDAPQDPPHKESSATNPVNGKQSAPSTSPKEIILREVYTVTDIPASILRIVRQQVQDAEAISQPTHAHPRVVASGAGLLALPTLVLAMFKATASSFYGMKLNSGQMYLYNDSMYLADQIREIVEEHQLTRLEPDIEALAKFGKFAYTKEMQTQRTIVTDLLDGAQGFGQCSEQPYLGECENAVSAAVDRIRDVYTEWQPILSHSALLQSVGSLVSTLINKMIIDIEDLGDISEPQSQRLVGFCSRVSQLEDLFVPQPSDHGEREPVPMTAVYVRNWLKFQYLVNILESSLADIKFLWVEGELRLEFSPDEVVDLIEALFAESDYRRKAIAEIRRVSRPEGLGW